MDYLLPLIFLLVLSTDTLVSRFYLITFPDINDGVFVTFSFSFLISLSLFTSTWELVILKYSLILSTFSTSISGSIDYKEDFLNLYTYNLFLSELISIESLKILSVFNYVTINISTIGIWVLFSYIEVIISGYYFISYSSFWTNLYLLNRICKNVVVCDFNLS